MKNTIYYTPMRLKSEEIERIVNSVVSCLKSKNLVTFKASEESVKARMIAIMTENFEQEEKLDIEVEEILKKFERQIDSGEVDYRKMFMKVKAQLAKERKIIL